MKPKITIHTATYNRAYILGKAYESLKLQTCKEFEWIVTDDGSTDETEQLLEQWMTEEPGFPIAYNKLDHVGIPRALNSGIALASADWFMMLDSDDHILPETVEKVLKWLPEIEKREDFAGIGFARCLPNGEYMKDQLPLIDLQKGYVDASHIERKKFNLNMDMCEVHRTAILRQFPFQYWECEFYAPEQLNFYAIGLAGYKLRWYPDKLYICDYLPDGQTKDDRLVKNNPMGFAMMYNQNILLSESLHEKAINVIRMTALTLVGGHPEYILSCNAKALALVTFPLGFILSCRRKRQYRLLDNNKKDGGSV